MPSYRVVLTDRAYAPVAELTNVAELQFFRGISKMATCSFKVRIDNPQSPRLAAVDGFIKLYRQGMLVFFGPIVTAEETADRETQTLAVNCADGAWMLAHRLSGRSPTGDIWASATSRHAIAQALINTANATSDTGVSTTRSSTSGSAITYKAGPYGNVLANVQELGAALDGYDWMCWPLDNWDNNAVTGTKFSEFQARTLIGGPRPDVVFEYGRSTRSNVMGYTISTTRDQQATQMYYIGPDPTFPMIRSNAAAQTAWGYLDDVVTGDITDLTLQQAIADEHVTIRGNPRTIVRMTPHIDPGDFGRVPAPFVDYDAGDTVKFRAVYNGVNRFSGSLRVYGITASVDENGFERVELTLEDQS